MDGYLLWEYPSRWSISGQIQLQQHQKGPTVDRSWDRSDNSCASEWLYWRKYKICTPAAGIEKWENEEREAALQPLWSVQAVGRRCSRQRTDAPCSPRETHGGAGCPTVYQAPSWRSSRLHIAMLEQCLKSFGPSGMSLGRMALCGVAPCKAGVERDHEGVQKWRTVGRPRPPFTCTAQGEGGSRG